MRRPRLLLHSADPADTGAPVPVTSVEPGDRPDRVEPAIVFRDAEARLGHNTVWSNLDLEIWPGEFVAVLGPNGVGKSTLIKATLGIVHLARGSARVLGHEPGHAGAEIGYLPQRRSFDPGLRVRGIDVVRLGLDGDRWGTPLPGSNRLGRRHREARARVDEVLDFVGAAPYARRPVGEVSGGEQQRLLIAQALVRDPTLLLLDEPLDSLDLPNQASVAALIGEICRQRGVTVVIVAHDVNPILPYLDRVVYLARGAAVCGRPADVITSEQLTRLYDTPIEVLHTSDGRLVVVGHPDAPSVHTDRHSGHPR